MTLKDNNDGTFGIVAPCNFEQNKPLTREQVFPIALDAGFMLSSQYGQGKDKLMPVTDSQTLMALVKAIEKAHGIK